MSDVAEASVSAYEALRRHVLTGAGTHAGLIVLLRQGVAAWMARRLACACSAVPTAAHASTPFVGREIHAAIVRGLASMALASQQEVGV